MRIWHVLLVLLILSGCESTEAPVATPPAQEVSSGGSSEHIPYEAEVIAQGLKVPWELSFAPDGTIFITERGGTIRLLSEGKLRQEPVYTPAAPFVSRGEAGLLGLVLDPDFASNRRMYVYYTYGDGSSLKNKVVRLIEKDGRAREDLVLIDGLPGQRNHDGGRLKIGPDGKLYVTVGDALDPDWSQDVSVLAGKILRLNLDGTIPGDNPYPGSPVYSLGHRNPQGLAWHPKTGALFSSEHGQSAHDEINVIVPGANYGWPRIEGDETRTSMRTPILHSGTTTWAPSGMTFVTRGPWSNQLLVSNLRGMQVLRIVLAEDQKSVKSTASIWNEYGRIRNIQEGPDGSLYLLTNNLDGRGNPLDGDDKIIRMKPTP
jgi:glucose/arabinose dehydrogenase